MQSNRSCKCLIFLAIISISVNIYFRLNTLFLTRCNQLAEKEVYRELAKSTEEGISNSYPDLPQSTKHKLGLGLFKNTLKIKKRSVKEEIKNKADSYKQFWQDERGWTYLLEVDPYRGLRRVENFLETGHLGTRIINGREVDELTNAPPELQVIKGKLHYYIGAYIYKLLHFFNRDILLMESLAFVPIIFSSILIIMIFIISSLLNLSNLSCFLNSLCIGLSPQVIFRTSFGWFDTDIYNVLLPLMIVIAVSYLFTDLKLRSKLFFLVLSGILMGTYAAIWIGWWYIFYIIIIASLLYLFNTYQLGKKMFIKDIKDTSFFLALLILICCICVVLFSGLTSLTDFYSIPSLFLTFRNFSVDNFWPNPGFTIGELRTPPIPELVDLVGGDIIFFGGIFGILSLFLKRGPLRLKRPGFLRLLLFIWLLFLLIAIRRGARFILMFSVPIGIGFGIFIDHIYFLFTEKIKVPLFLTKLNKRAYALFVRGVLGLFLIIPLDNARHVNFTPLMNDTWWDVLVKIKEATPPEAIINSWWDQGDWVTSISKRRAVNDAYFQYTSLPYWMARALLTRNERESIGILRMLNSGSYHAFNELNKNFSDKLGCLKIINKLILLKQERGCSLLSNYIKDEETVKRIGSLIYGPPPPAYIVIDDSLLFRLSAINFLGKWDFKRLEIYKKGKELKKEEFIELLVNRYRYNKEKSENFYIQLLLMDEEEALEWISSKKAFTILDNLNRKDITENPENLFFDNGLIIDMKNKNAFFLDTISNKWLAFKKLIYITFIPEKIEETIILNGDKDLAVLLMPHEEGRYRAIILDEEISKSLIVRLFFMNGIGLKHFKQVFHEKKEGFSDIYVYKIDWE